MPPIRVFAPAKINLALHVTGRRADGYHLLDSLVAFAPVGDWLQLDHADHPHLVVDGPEEAGVPTDASNLVLRAVQMHARACGLGGNLALRLTKNLPSASGIGGGSSDAAAALRGVVALANTPQIGWQDGVLTLALQGGGAQLDLAALGADVPMCYAPAPARTRGIGEVSLPTPLPPLPAVMVNPRVQVSTPAIFRALPRTDGAPMPEILPRFATAGECITWLRDQRNDLQPPAVAVEPVIDRVLAVLAAQAGAGLARMSGSGATCFALFQTQAAATTAAAAITRAQPDWWVAHGILGDQRAASAPYAMRATT